MKFLNMQKNKNLKKNSGFTMIESLVAIFIILLAITGPMVFAQNGLRTAFLSRDQITAFFLAQDVIESIKNYRNGEAKKIVDGTLDGSYW
jgi:prepilin-type N-terminal cleavage/methylation domain-containing protein